MSATSIMFIAVAAIAELIGLMMILVAIRGGIAKRPRNAILLIAGMMASAFGLILGGFTLAYDSAAPLDLAGEGAR
jgi:uncharacterized membrane protein